MNFKIVVIWALTAALIGMLACKPATPQKTDNRTEKNAPAKLEKVEPASKTTAVKSVTPIATKPLAVPEADQKAPAKFAVKLETTKGEIIIDVDRSWAPKGADRLYTLVKSGYYTDVAFFRVIDGFMAQTGISGDPRANAIWRRKRIDDDPVKQSNSAGMVTFAMAGPNSRTTQFFINFKNNARLDGMGFAPVGKVRSMKTVNKLYAEYGEGAPRGRGPSQRRLQKEGNAYLKAEFPKMDYIKQASIE